MARILITSAGGISAINCINALRKQNEVKIEIFAVDSDPVSVGLFQADKGFIVPKASDSKYLETILTICKDYKIDVVLPTHSLEIPVFSKSQGIFKSLKIGLAIPPNDAVEIFNDKWNSYNFFRKNKIPTPQTRLSESFNHDLKYPLFVKPRIGSGGKNSGIALSADDLSYFQRKQNQPFLIQELIDGQEFTVDMLTDKNYRIISAIVRERIKINCGLAVVARTTKNNYVLPYLENIAKNGHLIGPLNIQFIMNKEKVFFIDVNTRFAAGGLPLAVKAGVNIPLLTVKLALGEHIPISTSYKTNLTMIRYYTEFFYEEADAKQTWFNT